jgi:hypothetical protein
MDAINIALDKQFKATMDAVIQKGLNNIDTMVYVYIRSFLYSGMEPGLGCPTEVLHNWVDNVSLSGPEIDFFHKFLDLERDHNLIQNALKAYDETEDIKVCMLGGSIKRRLEMVSIDENGIVSV